MTGRMGGLTMCTRWSNALYAAGAAGNCRISTFGLRNSRDPKRAVGGSVLLA